MPNAAVSEVVTRPLVSPFATGSYTGSEFIAQNGQTLSLDLTKSANLTTVASGGAPAFTITTSESLSETITTTATQVMIHFALNMQTSVAITQANGSSNPFSANLSIQGDITFTPQKTSYCDSSGSSGGSYGSGSGEYGGHQGGSYGGQGSGGSGDCQGSSGGSSYGSQHGGDCGGQQPAFTLVDADTTFDFSSPGANGFALQTIANNAATSTLADTVVTDPSSASAGAAGMALGAGALQAAFGSSSPDPVQGISGDDANVMRAMAAAALAMIAQPNSQAVAAAVVLAATFAGAQLALDDGLAAFGVAANASSPIGIGVNPMVATPGATLAATPAHDMILFNPASGSATVAGFMPGIDQMHIDRSLAAGFANLLADATQTAAGAVIAFEPGHTLTLAGVSLASLSAGDFVFG